MSNELEKEWGLEKYLNDAINALNDASYLLQATEAEFEKVYNREDPKSLYKRVDKIKGDLEAITELLELRQRAFEELREVKNPNNPKNEGYLKNSFRHYRTLRIQAYMATTWSIYDIILKNLSFLSGAEERWKPNSKTVSFLNLMNGKDENFHYYFLGRIKYPITYKYGWPICFSYQLRNIFLHEAGLLDSGRTLFEEENILEEKFEINQDSLDQLFQEITFPKTGKHSWPVDILKNKPFDEMLELCHQQADEAFGILIKWSSESFLLEARLMLEPEVVMEE